MDGIFCVFCVLKVQRTKSFWGSVAFAGGNSTSLERAIGAHEADEGAQGDAGEEERPLFSEAAGFDRSNVATYDMLRRSSRLVENRIIDTSIGSPKLQLKPKPKPKPTQKHKPKLKLKSKSMPKQAQQRRPRIAGENVEIGEMIIGSKGLTKRIAAVVSPLFYDSFISTNMA